MWLWFMNGNITCLVLCSENLNLLSLALMECKVKIHVNFTFKSKYHYGNYCRVSLQLPPLALYS